VIFAPDCLAGRFIAVTGASSGIGRETAIMLSRCGARLALVGRDESRLAETEALLAGQGHSIHAADLATADGTCDVVLGIARDHGGMDGIFHAAGMTQVLPVKMTKSKQLDAVLGANLHGAFGIARAAARQGVVSDGGSLVFMSSSAGRKGRPALSAYCAAKAAVEGMVRSLAIEFANRRIRVNAIAAGAVETPMHTRFLSGVAEGVASEYQAIHPLGFGRPEDVAASAVFLLSDGGRWITGTSLAVDGGATAG
jgi:NAD(P)-dependent dehydrogenase (short-subunit alcohol dehydrogenase family)